MRLLGMLGVVCFRPNAPRRFYPTHLIVELCSDAAEGGERLGTGGRAQEHARGDGALGGAGGSSSLEAQVEQGRCLIVETNYRVYAYTSSVLQVEVLKLFARMCCKLPHMVIAVITRASIRNALVQGISASQIIDYLHLHAHPQVPPALVRRQTSLPPPMRACRRAAAAALRVRAEEAFGSAS